MIDRPLAPTTPLINELDQYLEIIAKPSSGGNDRLKVTVAQ
jgi:hypothetical protein